MGVCVAVPTSGRRRPSALVQPTMSLSSKLSITDVDLKAKRVLIRVDFNVPIQDGNITNPAVSLPLVSRYISSQLALPSEDRRGAAND